MQRVPLPEFSNFMYSVRKIHSYLVKHGHSNSYICSWIVKYFKNKCEHRCSCRSNYNVPKTSDAQYYGVFKNMDIDMRRVNAEVIRKIIEEYKYKYKYKY